MHSASPAPAIRATHQRGFTLIELMIAVGVIGLLSLVALPIFNDSIRKSRRSEAMSALTSIQQAQERWRANHAQYTTDLSSTGLNLPTSTPSGNYGMSVDTADGTGYTVRAAAVTGTSQAADGDCAQLRIRGVSGNLFYGSAPMGGSTFDESSSNRCWSR